MTAKEKKMLVRIGVSFFLFVVLLICDRGLSAVLFDGGWGFVLYAVPYLVIGYDIIRKAAVNICHGQVFDENFLMMLATFGAFAVSEYAEAVAVMLFYQVGELFQSYAVGRSRKSIQDLMDICPEYANVERDGELIQMDPEDIEIGEEIVILPGERIPLDGVVTEGESFLDTAALTGESVPRKAAAGEEIVSGCVNGSGTLRVKVTKVFDDSTVAKILELVENASSKKAKVENFITRFATYYTPIVTIAAALLAVIPPLLGGAWGDWIQRACIFLVISCPCALVISVPLGFFGGIGAASKIGVLIKGSNYLEAVSRMTTLVFDKTGTLTKGEFSVTEILPEAMEEEKLLELAALAEGYSTHPIAASIREAYGRKIDTGRLGDAIEIAGQGICIPVDGEDVLVGNEKLMKERGINAREYKEKAGSVVYIARGLEYAGAIVISDTVKHGAAEAIRAVKQAGVKKCIMLSGDRPQAAEFVARQLGIDEVYAGLLPDGKVEKVEQIMEQSDGEPLAFVGDGINDAPVLTRADVGIAMGSLGSDAAIEAADIVLMDDDIRKIASSVRIARKTLAIVKQNIVFALAVKAAVLILGALGLANMWEAVFADVGVSVLAILNAMRTLRTKQF